MSGMKFLHNHENKYVIRDFKLENVFVTKDFSQTKIGDLETITRIGELMGADRCTTGSVKYAAPEIIRGEKSSQATDAYALGGSMYYILSGEKPSSKGFIPQLNQIQDPKRYECVLSERLQDLINTYCYKGILVSNNIFGGEPVNEPHEKCFVIMKRLLSFDPEKRKFRIIQP